MRAVGVVAMLLLVGLSGCTGGAVLTEHGLFAFTPIVRGDPSPVPAADCPSLLQELNGRADEEAKVRLEQAIERSRDRVVMMAADDSAGLTADSAGVAAGSAAAADVTGTNNQEQDVDEADVLKTDGEWTYVLQQGTLHILHSEDVGDLALHHRMEIGGWGGTLLLEDRGTVDPGDDRLVVVVSHARPTGVLAADALGVEDRLHGMTRITVLGLADRSDPQVLDEVWIEGTSMGARLVDGTAYVIVHEQEQHLGLSSSTYPDDEMLQARGLDWNSFRQLPPADQQGLREEAARQAVIANEARLADVGVQDHLPVVLRPVMGHLIPEIAGSSVCARVLLNHDDTSRSVSSILSIGVGQEALPSDVTQVLGGRPIVYGAQDALVLAAPSNDFWWFWAQPDLEEATNIHWFDLDGLAVTHRASGRVDGIVQDQFGIDVHDGQLRVATTTGTWGRWWLEDPQPMLNHVVVMAASGGSLVETGRVGGIAPGERLWSARFTDDRAYLITFEQIDPLWVIDLADPAKPRVLGELEIPGVSTYIHPLSDDALLAIGYGPRADGTGLDWGRIQVSLFDISDVSEPTRADLLDLSQGQGWSSSAAVREHKAFTYWPAIGKLAVPVQDHQGFSYMIDGQWHWYHDNHVALRLIDVDEAAMTLSFYGEVDQDHLIPDDYWYGGIQRSYFLGFPQTGEVSVYAMSAAGMTAHDLQSLALQGSVPFG